MKKPLLISSLITGLLFFTLNSNGMAQFLSQSIPEEDRVSSIEIIELRGKVGKAKKIIETKGEKAFQKFREEGVEWLGAEEAIFVAHAEKGDINEGVFVLYPSVENVGEGAFDMSKVNGKHFVRKALAKHKKGDPMFFGFIAAPAGKVAHVSTVAITPNGRPYAIAAASRNLDQEKQFLKELVGAACNIVAKDGEAGFDIFQSKDSIFRFKNTYIYVMDGDHNILFDSGNPKYEGKNVVDLPKYFSEYKYPIISTNFKEAMKKTETELHLNTAEQFDKNWENIILKNGHGWMSYVTAKPGEVEMSRKISYNKTVKGPDGKVYVVGSGVYLANWENK